MKKGGKIFLIVFLILLTLGVIIAVIVSSNDDSDDTNTTSSTYADFIVTTDGIQSGDLVYLANQNDNCSTTNNGNFLTGCRGDDHNGVLTQPDCDSGGCNKWEIGKADGTSGTIESGNIVYLKNQNSNCSGSITQSMDVVVFDVTLATGSNTIAWNLPYLGINHTDWPLITNTVETMYNTSTSSYGDNIKWKIVKTDGSSGTIYSTDDVKLINQLDPDADDVYLTGCRGDGTGVELGGCTDDCIKWTILSAY